MLSNETNYLYSIGYHMTDISVLMSGLFKEASCRKNFSLHPQAKSQRSNKCKLSLRLNTNRGYRRYCASLVRIEAVYHTSVYQCALRSFITSLFIDHFARSFSLSPSIHLPHCSIYIHTNSRLLGLDWRNGTVFYMM